MAARKKPQPQGKPKTFQALLTRKPGNLGWTIVAIPFDAAALWGVRGSIRVAGEINGFAFRTSLFPDGKGNHFLLVNRAMQKGGHTSAGMVASFRLAPDLDKPRFEAPAELMPAINQDRRLRRYFDSLTPSMRNDIARHVAEPKSPEARRRRAEQLAERLMSALLAERGELPPLLQAALIRNPVAKHGWDLMPPSKKRFHILGLTGYKSPESQQKRLAKTLEEAAHYAEKAAQRGKSGD
jgi:uncharacterized protein YdeI (YjbR/CyaY-like superfamily)